MQLYIRIVNGQPFEHPILEDNFVFAFPDVDISNLPSEFARFERVECPQLATTFQVDEAHYEWFGDVVKDVWTVREMTAEEIVIKQAEIDEQAARIEQDRLEREAILSQMSGSAPNVIG
jgi:hypothetical protein